MRLMHFQSGARQLADEQVVDEQFTPRTDVDRVLRERGGRQCYDAAAERAYISENVSSNSDFAYEPMCAGVQAHAFFAETRVALV